MNPRLPDSENPHAAPEDLLLDEIPLDKILLDDTILPTSGFAASVMDRIAAEASAPAPIPFPWKFALPGLAALLLAILAAIRLISEIRRNLAAHPGLDQLDLGHLANSPLATQAFPAIAAVAGALLCLLLTRYLALGRSSR